MTTTLCVSAVMDQSEVIQLGVTLVNHDQVTLDTKMMITHTARMVEASVSQLS